MSTNLDDRGLECPACGCQHFNVIETRRRGGRIVRRRECRYCGKRLTTHERAVDDPEVPRETGQGQNAAGLHTRRGGL